MNEANQTTAGKKGSRSKGRPRIDRDLCKGCELCLEVCPEKVLHLSESTNSLGVHYAEFDEYGICTACKSCAIMCPDCAIEILKFETGE